MTFIHKAKFGRYSHYDSMHSYVSRFTPHVTTETDKSAPVQTVKIRSTFITGSSAVQLEAQNNKDTLKMRKRSRDAGYRIEGTVAPGYESVKRMFEENFVSGTDER